MEFITAYEKFYKELGGIRRRLHDHLWLWYNIGNKEN